MPYPSKPSTSVSMAATLSAMSKLNNLLHEPLLEILGEAIGQFAEVTRNLAATKIELLGLQDEKRRLVVGAMDATLDDALRLRQTSLRERTFKNKKITSLVGRIRDLESERLKLESKREIYDRAIRAFGYAIDLRTGQRR